MALSQSGIKPAVDNSQAIKDAVKDAIDAVVELLDMTKPELMEVLESKKLTVEKPVTNQKIIKIILQA